MNSRNVAIQSERTISLSGPLAHSPKEPLSLGNEEQHHSSLPISQLDSTGRSERDNGREGLVNINDGYNILSERERVSPLNFVATTPPSSVASPSPLPPSRHSVASISDGSFLDAEAPRHRIRVGPQLSPRIPADAVVLVRDRRQSPILSPFLAYHRRPTLATGV